MRTVLIIPALAMLASGAMAVANSGGSSGGRLTTLERGDYVCERPGDAAIGRGVPMSDENFTIANASTYITPEGGGTYLRVGKMVTMTSGPRKGDRYKVRTERFLRKLGEDGAPTGLRCIRIGATPN